MTLDEAKTIVKNIYEIQLKKDFESTASDDAMTRIDDAFQLLLGQQTWTPVKEATPATKGFYWVTLKANIGVYVDTASWSDDLHKVDEFDFPVEHRPGWYGYDSEYGHYEITDVVAWMSPPQPYREKADSL